MSKRNGKNEAMEQSQNARAEQLKKWRMSGLHEATLPSGLDVTLRDVDIQSILIEGDIPNTLVDLIGSEEFQGLSEEERTKKFLLEHRSDFNVLMRQIVRGSLVEPKIGETADDEHILYGELTFNDKMFIFNYLNREATAVRSFRGELEEPDQTA